MEAFSQYVLGEKIHESRNSTIYRGHKEYESRHVIIKVLKTKYPTPSEIARFKQEYNLVKNIDLDGIVKTYELIEHNNQFAIIEEEFDGVSLKELIKAKKTDITSFLHTAIKISETLGILHKNNIIHMDIKPDNILVNEKTSTVKITDFGISAALTHANDEIYNPNVIRGTLAYMSPEQTGRMNRSVDYRTDLYSLGVTFYEMLTGEVPFMSKDPMELIHSHIARQPSPPSDLDSSIPPVVSGIILKLLSKTPEERYQNSFGLMADIDECLNQVSKKGSIDEFMLGSRDISVKFNVPQIIVGREKELNTLMESFERVSAGTSEIMLVMGHPGIGKSALVNEIYKSIVMKKEYFIFGKYDQFRKEVPYSAIIQAFQGLIRQLLAESQDRIDSWKDKLLFALGSNGRVVTGVIPELELIIGKQPDVPSLTPEETWNRFNMVFQNFINVFTTEDHPLAIFLDDLQWADLASLNLIKNIITNYQTKFMSLIGAYRDTEVGGHHPLLITFDEIRKTGKKINSISLNPLDAGNVNLMIMNVLRCRADESMSLAEIIHRKTGGNPFFINQFLKNLYDNHLIEINSESVWEWDVNKIEQMQVTDNVVEFMAGKISKLPKNAQDILKICACIGNRFDLETLSIVSGKSIEETLSDLTSALKEDMISLHGDIYKFHHDRIQEAAYSLIPEYEKASMHYKIGNNVLKKTDAKDMNEKVFYIVDQLNMGITLITGSDERINLANLNLTAVRKAKNSTAYSSALNYARAGMELLPEDCWQSQYNLTYNLNMERMSCEYLTLNFAEAERIFQKIINNTKTNLEKGFAYIAIVILYTAQGNYKEALRVAFEGMAMFGLKAPKRVSNGKIAVELLKLYFKFGKRKIEDLVDIPLATDMECIIYRLLALCAATVAYYINVNLYSFIIIDALSDTLKFGLYQYSPITLCVMGSIIGPGIGLYEQGYRFGETSLKLNEKMGIPQTKAIIGFLFAELIQHWRKHAKYDIDFYRDSYKRSLEVGNLTYASHNINMLGMTRIMLGDNIDEILEEYEKYKNFLTGGKDPFVGRNYKENIQMCLCLQGTTDRMGKLDSADFDEEAQIQYYRKEGNLLGIYYFSLVKLRIRYLFGEYSECLPISAELLQLGKKKIAIGNLHVPEANFYSSLALAALCPAAKFGKRIKYKKAINVNQKQMKIWSKNCPENFLHKYLLVEAELTEIRGNHKKATSLYDEAIKSAHENGYTQNEAIANERAALLMMELGKIERARQYIKEAHYGYIRWGATAKVQDLEEKFSDLIHDSLRKTGGDSTTDTDTSSRTTGSRALDLNTVIRTSQLLSSEIDLGKLLTNIMKLSIENAGAERGFLLLEREEDNKLYIEATGRIDATVEVLKSILLDNSDSLSASIVHYVNKTGENIVLNDAAADQRFINDPYIIANHPKSILCAPIRHKGKSAGIIYLENNLTTYAFTAERLELLQIFSAQAAISIENSRLIILRESSAKLQTEMQIAASIQSSLLPENPVIPGFETTAYMKPADDIGGDYYDVINIGDFNWLIIGDVSGHGVPAGLVMMMVQTAIQTQVRRYPDTRPSELLSIVNEVIKYNLGKMKTDKYMTITAFSFEKDGKAAYSGLHQDILIYRASTDKIETIHPVGIWLSPWDMGQVNVEKELVLKQGDVLLLYTDGITEAMDSRDIIFSQDRLLVILKQYGKLNTDAIRDKILEALQGYSLKDDVTMVLIKKK
jgi:histidine kinase